VFLTYGYSGIKKDLAGIEKKKAKCGKTFRTFAYGRVRQPFGVGV